jgi:hypothetical protein
LDRKKGAQALNPNCKLFIEQLSAVSNSLEEQVRATFDYWHPEEPPLTTLFADLGQKIVDTIENTGTFPHPVLFSLIEEGMKSGDSELDTAVATGLVEAIVAFGTESRHWKNILESLGPRTRSYAEFFQ